MEDHNVTLFKQRSDQKVIFITGKGGVGKSVVSMATALYWAEKGQRVLLVELGESEYLSRPWEKYRLNSPTVTSVESQYRAPGGALFSMAQWRGRECLKEYVLHYVKLKKITDLFFDNKILGQLISAAPALDELSILGKATSGLRNFGRAMEFDKIIIDSYSTGHFLALLKAPIGMYEAIRWGIMGETCAQINAVLKNPHQVEYKVVTLAEEMATAEAIELCEELKSGWGIQPEIICNKCGPDFRWGEVSTEPLLKDYYSYFKNKNQSQQKSFEKMKNLGWSYQKWPYLFVTDVIELSQRLVQYNKMESEVGDK